MCCLCLFCVQNSPKVCVLNNTICGLPYQLSFKTLADLISLPCISCARANEDKGAERNAHRDEKRLLADVEILEKTLVSVVKEQGFQAALSTLLEAQKAQKDLRNQVKFKKIKANILLASEFTEKGAFQNVCFRTQPSIIYSDIEITVV